MRATEVRWFARRLVRWFARHQRRKESWVVHRPPTGHVWVMTPDLYFQWDENGDMQVIGPNGVIPKDSPDYPLRAVDVVRLKGDGKEIR